MAPCIYCGHQAEHRDHIVPRCSGGSDDQSNLAPSCASCNFAKGGRSVEHFLRQHPAILDRVHRYQAGEDVFTGLEPGEKPRAKDGLISLSYRMAASQYRRMRRFMGDVEDQTGKRITHQALIDEAVEDFLKRKGA